MPNVHNPEEFVLKMRELQSEILSQCQELCLLVDWEEENHEMEKLDLAQFASRQQEREDALKRLRRALDELASKHHQSQCAERDLAQLKSKLLAAEQKLELRKQEKKKAEAQLDELHVEVSLISEFCCFIWSRLKKLEEFTNRDWKN
eukprot:TRINITY_DN12483_c0_g1_i1.p1 TRINITY_DN12483_c0_g1~~TRINITY_DN12483_c0_g1_i1.p1  ORF type:complete len:147 (+),score=44.16 TRINITY_DN12483_c0_g1_i1:175-615(+)